MSNPVKNAVIQTSIGTGISSGMYAYDKDENALAANLINVGAWEGLEYKLKTALSRRSVSNAIGQVSGQAGKTITQQTTTATKGATSSAIIGSASKTLSATIIGPVLLITQLASIMIDIFADPYYSYNNKSLSDLKKHYEESMRLTLQELYMSYPIKAYPSMVNYDSQGNIKFDQEILNYFQKYLEDNNLYIQEDEEKTAVIAKKIKTSRLFQLSSSTDTDFLTFGDSLINQDNYLYGAAGILLIKLIEKRQKENEYKEQKIQFYVILLIYGTLVFYFLNQILK